MPEEITNPKLSALLNNCALHALTPEIKNEIIKFGADEQYDNQHNAAYNRLKDIFANFYECNPDTFTWKAFAKILECYNSFDTQIIMGLALRMFMKRAIGSNEMLPFLASEAQCSQEEYINNLTNINPSIGRYDSLSPDQVFVYVSHDLGLSLHYYAQAGNQQKLDVQNSIATVTMYHQGGIDGAGAGGHWERTRNGNQSINYQIYGSTELEPFLFFLGIEDPSLYPYGLSIIKKHVNLTAQIITQGNNLCDSAMKQDAFMDQFMELNCSAVQIEQYLFNIKSVPKELAITLLGEPLTATTIQFIDSYNFQEVGKTDRDNLTARYITAVISKSNNKPQLEASEEEIITRLLTQPPHLQPKITRNMEFDQSMPKTWLEQKTSPQPSNTTHDTTAELKTVALSPSLLTIARTVPKIINENEFNTIRTSLLDQAIELSTQLVTALIDQQSTFKPIYSFFREFSNTFNSNKLHARDSLQSQQIALVGTLIEVLRRMTYDEDIRPTINALKKDLCEMEGRPRNPSSIVMEVQFENLPKQIIVKQFEIQSLLTSIETLSQASTEFSRIEPQPGFVS